ncbi:signal peptide peptidase SppA [Azospirillum halopraeferens]|uniref:signal peptide peptidase SppA n=1 Tax=Azospirillum halopraeferens TaxID=34010 RepID=UPI000428A5D6|nr:signal peptide peptidase SppA [Azospirillum halopraeferens]
MITFIVRLFALVGFLVIAGIAVLVYVLLNRGAPALPDTVVLELNLDRPLADAPPTGSLAFLEESTTLRDVLATLERARTDPRVKGLVARMGSDDLGFAQVQELRTAVQRFRESGRFAYAFATSFGGGGPGNRAYLLATAFDEVWLQPLGVVGLTGLSAEVPFAGKALEDLGIRPQVVQREAYKTLAESFTRTDFSPAHREMMESLVADLSGQLVSGVAEGRGLAPDMVRALIDRAPLLDAEALDNGLVDRLGYRDEAMAAALAQAGPGAHPVEVPDYRDSAGDAHEQGPTVALIHVQGTIVDGRSEVDPLMGSLTAGSETVVKAFEDALEDPDVVAIVLRVDSGGGSVTASEAIRRAVVNARTTGGRPVIVSMGDAAASGGYWVAMDADRIVTGPATLTGSIGVVAGKPVAEELSRRIGVSWGVVQSGRNAGMWSPVRPFDDSGLERLNALVDRSYTTFLERVAAARRMTPEAVRAAAQGRVWTGAEAAALGLVDELGGLEQALIRAREAAGLAADAAITVAVFPRPKSPLERAMDFVSGRGEIVESGAALAALRDALPLATHLRPLVEASRPGVLAVMPPTGLLPPR